MDYKLKGICIHSGSLNGGHYYSMCYNYQTQKWNIFIMTQMFKKLL